MVFAISLKSKAKSPPESALMSNSVFDDILGTAAVIIAPSAQSQSHDESAHVAAGEASKAFTQDESGVHDRVADAVLSALDAVMRGEQNIKIIADSQGAVEAILVANELKRIQRLYAENPSPSLKELMKMDPSSDYRMPDALINNFETLHQTLMRQQNLPTFKTCLASLQLDIFKSDSSLDSELVQLNRVGDLKNSASSMIQLQDMVQQSDTLFEYLKSRNNAVQPKNQDKNAELSQTDTQFLMVVFDRLAQELATNYLKIKDDDQKDREVFTYRLSSSITKLEEEHARQRNRLLMFDGDVRTFTNKAILKNKLSQSIKQGVYTVFKRRAEELSHQVSLLDNKIPKIIGSEDQAKEAIKVLSELETFIQALKYAIENADFSKNRVVAGYDSLLKSIWNEYSDKTFESKVTMRTQQIAGYIHKNNLTDANVNTLLNEVPDNFKRQVIQAVDDIKKGLDKKTRVSSVSDNADPKSHMQTVSSTIGSMESISDVASLTASATSVTGPDVDIKKGIGITIDIDDVAPREQDTKFYIQSFKDKYKELCSKQYFKIFRKSNIDVLNPFLTLKEITEHAMAKGNRSFEVMKSLQWVDSNGQLKDNISTLVDFETRGLNKSKSSESKNSNSREETPHERFKAAVNDLRSKAPGEKKPEDMITRPPGNNNR